MKSLVSYSGIKKYAATSFILFFTFTFWGPAFGGISLGPASFFPSRIFALLTWGFVALAAILAPSGQAFNKSTLQRHRAHIFLGIWLLWACVSLLWSIDRGQGVRDLFNLFMGLSLVGLAPLFLRDRKSIERAAGIWKATLAIFLIIALGEHLTTLHFPLSRFSQGFQPHLNYRPTVVFVNENNFAVFLSFSIPLLLAQWRYFAGRSSRILTGLGLFLSIYMLFVTGSRINILVLIITALVYSFLLTPKGRRLKVFMVLMLLIVGVWFIFGLTQPTVRGYVARRLGSLLDFYRDLFDQREGEFMVSNTSIAVRINMVRNGVTFLLRTFGVGVGVGNFEAWIETRAVYNTLDILNPHNWWIELVTEYGILITLGYLAFFTSLALAAWRGWKQTQGKGKWLPEALCLILIIFPIVAISPSQFLDYHPQWIVLSLAFAWQKNGMAREGSEIAGITTEG